MATPLQKKKEGGELYRRPDKIQKAIEELELLTGDDLVARCAIRDANDLNYVPNECLLYFVRATRRDNQEKQFDRLFKILFIRLQKAVPKGGQGKGDIDLTKDRIAEIAQGWFLERLAEDRAHYCERLDYFEIRFNAALSTIRTDAKRIAFRESTRSTALEDPETNELNPEVEKAAGSQNPFENEENVSSDYQLALYAAIDTLPEEQIMIIQLLLKGTKIDTIATILNCAEKTVRNRRDKAYAVIRAALREVE